MRKGKLKDGEIRYLKPRKSKEEKLLAEALTKYIKAGHTQDECTGFIDGFEAAQAIEKEVKEFKVSLVPSNNKSLDKLYADLSIMKDVNVCKIKGMIFIKSFSDSSYLNVQEYLADNKGLFEFAK